MKRSSLIKVEKYKMPEITFTIEDEFAKRCMEKCKVCGKNYIVYTNLIKTILDGKCPECYKKEIEK